MRGLGGKKVNKREAIVKQVVDGPASADLRAIKIMFDLMWETRRVRRSRHLPRPPLSPKLTRTVIA